MIEVPTNDSLGEIVHGAGLFAAGANVIMQLARPGVGYGVMELWVAACRYRGLEDVFAALGGALDPAAAAEIYRRSHTLGTTLQVRESMWPENREAFGR